MFNLLLWLVNLSFILSNLEVPTLPLQHGFEQSKRLDWRVLQYCHWCEIMQARNQEPFRAGEFSWNRGTSIYNTKNKGPAGINLQFFLLKTFKNCTWIGKLYHRCPQSGNFPQKLGNFFPISGKGQLHKWHYIVGFFINTAFLNVCFMLHYHLFFRKEIYFFECLCSSEYDIRMSWYVFWLR